MDNEDKLPPSPIPRLGPCGICGWHPDQRHRILDAIIDRLLAGEDLDDVCDDYEWTPQEIRGLYYDVTTNLAEMATAA
jgi:hypothetical protein